MVFFLLNIPMKCPFVIRFSVLNSPLSPPTGNSAIAGVPLGGLWHSKSHTLIKYNVEIIYKWKYMYYILNIISTHLIYILLRRHYVEIEGTNIYKETYE
jgi:hypothetical protein